MLWLPLMALADGSRVESSLPTIEETAARLTGRIYRVRRPDGSVHVFPTLTSVFDHLRGHYEMDDLRQAADRHPT